MKCHDAVHYCESIFIHSAGPFSGLSNKATQSLISGKILKIVIWRILSLHSLFFFSFWSSFYYLFSISIFLSFCNIFLSSKHSIEIFSSFLLSYFEFQELLLFSKYSLPFLKIAFSSFFANVMPFLVSFWLILIVFVEDFFFLCVVSFSSRLLSAVLFSS